MPSLSEPGTTSASSFAVGVLGTVDHWDFPFTGFFCPFPLCLSSVMPLTHVGRQLEHSCHLSAF